MFEVAAMEAFLSPWWTASAMSPPSRVGAWTVMLTPFRLVLPPLLLVTLPPPALSACNLFNPLTTSHP